MNHSLAGARAEARLFPESSALIGSDAEMLICRLTEVIVVYNLGIYGRASLMITGAYVFGEACVWNFNYLFQLKYLKYNI